MSGTEWTGHLKVVSYNIHGCVGIDQRFSPERIADVIGEMKPDVVGLQEVDTRRGRRHGVDVIDVLHRRTGLEIVFGPTMGSSVGEFGNALMSRLPFLEVRHHDVSHGEAEPRAVLDARLDMRPGRLRVLLTHLGLSRRERRVQFGLIRKLVNTPNEADATILLGDTNAWRPWSRELRQIDALMGGSPRPRTYPACVPILRLDRIWLTPSSDLRVVEAYRSRKASRASDHLPVFAVAAL